MAETETTLSGVADGEHTYAIRPREQNGGGTLGDYSNRVSVTVEPISTDIVVNDIIYTLVDDIMVVTGYVGDSSSYTVEEEVNGYIVKRIGESAFEGNTNLEAIDLPDTIEVIEAKAFKNCTNLSQMS